MTDSEKLDAVLAAVRDMADQVIRMDQNLVVVAARLDALEPSVDNVARALVSVGREVHDLHEALIEESDRTGARLKVLEGSNGHG